MDRRTDQPLQLRLLAPDGSLSRVRSLSLAQMREQFGAGLAGDAVRGVLSGKAYTHTLSDGRGLLVHCPERLHATLASQCSGDWSRVPLNVRLRLARSSRESGLLAGLAGDRRSAGVRAAVAVNPATSTDVLLHLAGDPEPRVAAAVAAREQLPSELIESLLRAGEIVRLTLSQNPDCPAAALEALLEDGSVAVRVSALEHPELDPWRAQNALWELVRSSQPHARVAAASAARLDEAMLEELCRDSDSQVLLAAARRRRLREHLQQATAAADQPWVPAP